MNVFKAARKKAQYTQSKAASVLGVNRSTISKWETGSALPEAKTLPALAALYGCTIDDLFQVDRPTPDRPA